jgi:hypothetical protein
MRATTDMSLINIFSEGPEVSLKGSPTVSPTTAAEWAGLPLPPRFPASMYFFALSQDPPALAMVIARRAPDEIAPRRRPPTASAPRNGISPTTMGTMTASSPGRTISRRAALVLRSTHLAYSALTPGSPSLSPGISLNWRRTSSTMSCAALPTASIVRALNTNGIKAPMSRPASVETLSRSMDVRPTAWA